MGIATCFLISHKPAVEQFGVKSGDVLAQPHAQSKPICSSLDQSDAENL